MKIVGKAVEILSNINQSKGAHDLSSYIAHGATELANFNIHGHAAPMYTHGASPQGSVYGQEDFDKHNQESERRDAGDAQAKLERASQGMKSRMETPQPSQDQERSR
jgi:hypothetical protein